MTAALDAHVAFVVGAGDARFQVDATLLLDTGLLVLFGPSGAGKTLTLKALAGLAPVTSGHVHVRGVTLVDTERGIATPTHERRVGYVPQAQTLFPFLDVAANVAFGLPRHERGSARVSSCLRELGIEHLARARPASLSGGERQRVALARALVTEPRLLLLDEPFASIDKNGTLALRALVRDVIARHAIPVVLVTHDADEAASIGDALVRFERGKTVEQGAPAVVLGRRRGETRVQGRVVDVVSGVDGVARGTLADAKISGPPDRVRLGLIDLHTRDDVPPHDGSG
jgi:molybdate transport system ATP-binding protein